MQVLIQRFKSWVCCVHVWINECMGVVFYVSFYMCCVQVWLCGVLTGPSRCPLLCMCPLPPHTQFTGDLDGHWWDHSSWHSSEASPMSLVRHAGSCLDINPDPFPPILSLYPCMSVLPDPRVFSHFMFPSLYLHLCMLFFLSVFYPTPVGESQRGKRKTYEQTFMSEPTHTLSERQKKMVRFGGHSLEEDLAWCEPQVKDSGVDTCSSTTLNEEHSHSEKVLSQSSLHFVVIYNLPIQSVCSLSLSVNRWDVCFLDFI